jgi:uncharacterized protein
MIGRILLWVVLGFVAWWMLRPRRAAAPPSATSRGPAAAAPPPEAMVDCASCGLHFPASEAVRDGAARLYCCTAHRDAGPRRGQ